MLSFPKVCAPGRTTTSPTSFADVKSHSLHRVLLGARHVGNFLSHILLSFANTRLWGGVVIAVGGRPGRDAAGTPGQGPLCPGHNGQSVRLLDEGEWNRQEMVYTFKLDLDMGST